MSFLTAVSIATLVMAALLPFLRAAALRRRRDDIARVAASVRSLGDELAVIRSKLDEPQVHFGEGQVVRARRMRLRLRGVKFKEEKLFATSRIVEQLRPNVLVVEAKVPKLEKPLAAVRAPDWEVEEAADPTDWMWGFRGVGDKGSKPSYH